MRLDVYRLLWLFDRTLNVNQIKLVMILPLPCRSIAAALLRMFFLIWSFFSFLITFLSINIYRWWRWRFCRHSDMTCLSLPIVAVILSWWKKYLYRRYRTWGSTILFFHCSTICRLTKKPLQMQHLGSLIDFHPISSAAAVQESISFWCNQCICLHPLLLPPLVCCHRCPSCHCWCRRKLREYLRYS